ncbi:hypothetical protein PMIN01_12681 [Paraphaeosphaeria minitans]|uniref:Uncharacterized protein n=1 Tax=Paraphaeosphaeria minitans TaxID=565426 RepID=A0A9P6G4M0_9PLEO|nr:hypothetical protein PMIN01_12681 [Paraphaeosphaeria minitans]
MSDLGYRSDTLRPDTLRSDTLRPDTLRSDTLRPDNTLRSDCSSSTPRTQEPFQLEAYGTREECCTLSSVTLSSATLQASPSKRCPSPERLQAPPFQALPITSARLFRTGSSSVPPRRDPRAHLPLVETREKLAREGSKSLQTAPHPTVPTPSPCVLHYQNRGSEVACVRILMHRAAQRLNNYLQSPSARQLTTPF